ncbi:membrane protein insertase YidC [Curtobacterium sp. MCPF17_047]|uniref:membrane protein insertase YidC n=1 Tax=unclassified Curtobacterium TaxID=257496 RepID=UPI000DA7C93C|nr:MULTISPECIES: membrane protein insertase YidC [unclassified Curtobacterium]PZE63106.1 membrane protein insertase YidC [Curtobacterium sp. MCPF17_001]PZF68937.1 membrane protein insertase YidC [Curtobacterium sp. MCPF17_047]
MDLIGTILWPLKWVVSAILVGFHWVFENLGMDPSAGITWVLSIIFLTFVVRGALIPIFVRQIKSQRRMLEVAPQLKKIQDKYKGKKDQFSREAMSRETMALYKETGTNPLSSCLPLLIQMPIFFSLYSVLHEAQINKTGIGLLSSDLAKSFGNASLFGAPLHETFTNASGWEVRVIAGFMIVVMTASQFITQLQLVAKNMSPETKESPMYRQQKMMLYVLPLVFVISGLSFPLGVMFYWLASNIWTMAQQYFVIRSMPTPGSEAALAREARLAKKAQRSGSSATAGVLTEAGAGASLAEVEARVNNQRQQPVGKSRAKKNGKTK